MRWMIVLVLLVAVVSGKVFAQTDTPLPTATETPTETPTPTPTNTPTPEPFVYATIAPETTDEIGQMTRFDYVATAGDVHIATLLTAQLLSMWAMFLFGVLVLSTRRK